MAGQPTMFIMEVEEQEVSENGERMEVSLFSEPATVPGEYIVFRPPSNFLYHNLHFTDKVSGTEKPRGTECLVPGHPASTWCIWKSNSRLSVSLQVRGKHWTGRNLGNDFDPALSRTQALPAHCINLSIIVPCLESSQMSSGKHRNSAFPGHTLMV